MIDTMSVLNTQGLHNIFDNVTDIEALIGINTLESDVWARLEEQGKISLSWGTVSSLSTPYGEELINNSHLAVLRVSNLTYTHRNQQATYASYNLHLL